MFGWWNWVRLLVFDWVKIGWFLLISWKFWCCFFCEGGRGGVDENGYDLEFWGFVFDRVMLLMVFDIGGVKFVVWMLGVILL